VEEKLKKQQEITDAVITAQERERSFLGEELHDNINQILATSKLYMDLAIAANNLRKDLMTDSRNFTMTAMEEIRKLSKSLLPPSLGETSLPDALSELVENIRQGSTLHFIKEWECLDESVLNEKLSLVIFRIVQEQLNNIFKHAKAKTVFIGFKKVDGILQLRIKDDGRGFDTSEKRKGIGLKNIVSRADLFNGEVIVNSKPGEGCELVVNFKNGLHASQ
jgi:signal transduction histidine kinase